MIVIKTIKQTFIKGLFALLPIVITLYALYFFISLLDNFLGGFITLIFGRPLPGIGLLASLILILITGFFVTNFVGARIVSFGENLIHKIPIVHKIYFGVKQIIDSISLQGKQLFSKVVLVEYPRKGYYAMGFVTGECKGEVQDKTSAHLVNVFIPTTPNPTSGMLILVPQNEIIYLDMTIEEGLKLIISAGVVVPESQEII